MKRVTFRVPEDHEIAVSAIVQEMVVTAHYGDDHVNVAVFNQTAPFGDDIEYGAFAYGWFPTINEAQTAAAGHARAQLRRLVLSRKTRVLA